MLKDIEINNETCLFPFAVTAAQHNILVDALQPTIESITQHLTDARAVEQFHEAATIALGGEDRMHQWALALLELLPITVIQDVLESRLQRADVFFCVRGVETMNASFGTAEPAISSGLLITIIN